MFSAPLTITVAIGDLWEKEGVPVAMLGDEGARYCQEALFRPGELTGWRKDASRERTAWMGRLAEGIRH